MGFLGRLLRRFVRAKVEPVKEAIRSLKEKVEEPKEWHVPLREDEEPKATAGSTPVGGSGS